MSYTTIARTRAVAAVASLVLVLGVLAGGVAHAQFLPAVFYGTGLEAGQTVEAFIEGKSCGSTKTNDAGEWIMQIPPDAPCAPAPGTPISRGATVAFTLDGQPAAVDPPATWESGGIPTANIRQGYTLTVEGAGGSGNIGAETAADGDSDGGRSNAMLLVGGGVILLVAAAAGGFFLFRRNSA
jgi:hypothetical protein